MAWITEGFEPDVAASAHKQGANDQINDRLLEVYALASAAISLKRIADAMATVSGPLNAYGETLGECIQGQHERGLRGIPNP